MTSYQVTTSTAIYTVRKQSSNKRSFTHLSVNTNKCNSYIKQEQLHIQLSILISTHTHTHFKAPTHRNLSQHSKQTLKLLLFCTYLRTIPNKYNATQQSNYLRKNTLVIRWSIRVPRNTT